MFKPPRVAILVLLFSASLVWASEVDDKLKRGRYLLHAGGCIACHTEKDAEDTAFMAGGPALETPFGLFYAPNITPDKETGIGDWSDEDFIRAFREGLSPDDEHYYPVFPYTSYTGVRDEDLLALKAYLFSLAPIKRSNQEHELSWYVSFRFLLGPWKWLNFEPGVFAPDPKQSEVWNRGAYLVRHLGHCGECHTPRNWMGGLDDEQSLAGNPDGPEGDAVPNITPDKETGIGVWSIGDIEDFLEIGLLPDGDFAGGSMSEVIDVNTAQLDAADRKAIATYLKSLPPLPSAAE